MKLKLLLMASTALIITSCSKNNDELPMPKGSETIENVVASKKKSRTFNGILTMHPESVIQYACGCAPGFFAIGPFSGAGILTNFGCAEAITTPCVANIPSGLRADTQCVRFKAPNGDELYMVAAAPYDNVINPNTNLIVGNGTFNITGGTGKYLNASGSYFATVINNLLIVPPGTPPTVITIITGTIIY